MNTVKSWIQSESSHNHNLFIKLPSSFTFWSHFNHFFSPVKNSISWYFWYHLNKMRAFWRDRRISCCMKSEHFSFSFQLPLKDSIIDVLKSLKGWRELSWAHIWMIMKKSFEQSWKCAQDFCMKNEFLFEIFFVYLYSNILKMISSLNVRVRIWKVFKPCLIQHFPFFEVRVSYWSIRKP